MRLYLVPAILAVLSLSGCDGETDLTNNRGAYITDETPSTGDVVSENATIKEKEGSGDAVAEDSSLQISWDAPTDTVEISHYFLRITEGDLAGWEKTMEVGKDIELLNPKTSISISSDTKLAGATGQEVCFVLIAGNADGESEATDQVCATL